MSKQRLKDVLIMLGVSLVVIFLFGSYLVLIGFPTTTARNYYNQAQLTNDIYEKKTLLELSLQSWYSASASNELDYINELVSQE